MWFFNIYTIGYNLKFESSPILEVQSDENILSYKICRYPKIVHL